MKNAPRAIFGNGESLHYGKNRAAAQLRTPSFTFRADADLRET
jgi:hypothetical protein